MLGDSQIIVNNKLSGLGRDCIIHVDYATIRNVDTGYIAELMIETTGCMLDGAFRSFKDYIFFIQNNLIQHSGSCVTTNNLVINSNRVRIQRGEECFEAVIIDNILVEMNETTYVNRVQTVYRQDTTEQNITSHNPPVKPVFKDSLVKIVSDSQNVHNSNIVNRFKYIYFKMKELIARARVNGSAIDMNLRSCHNIISLVYRNNSDSNRLKLKDVLTYSKAQNGFIHNLSANETDIFREVVIFIHTCVNEDYINDTLTLLADNIVDCVEQGEIVCLTGRVTRMLNSILHLVDIHLEKEEKYPTVKDAMPEMLKICSNLSKDKEVTEVEVKEALCKEFSWLDRKLIEKEVDKWF